MKNYIRRWTLSVEGSQSGGDDESIGHWAMRWTEPWDQIRCGELPANQTASNVAVKGPWLHVH